MPRRVVLTQQQAAEIFELKSIEDNELLVRRSGSRSRLVAERYGVSPKTVRDIWNCKTWICATKQLFQRESNELDSLESSGPSMVLGIFYTPLNQKTDKWCPQLHRSVPIKPKKGGPRQSGSNFHKKRKFFPSEYSSMHVTGEHVCHTTRASSTDSDFTQAQCIQQCIHQQTDVDLSAINYDIISSRFVNYSPDHFTTQYDVTPPHLELPLQDCADQQYAGILVQHFPDDPFHFDWPHW